MNAKNIYFHWGWRSARGEWLFGLKTEPYRKTGRALIYNTDRHFGNFGLLVDSRTNQIVAPAPLFDHGNSLFNLAGEENWADKKLLKEYAGTLLPCVYEDYVEEAKSVLDNRLKEKLRRMLTYELSKSGRTNYSTEKLKLISELLRDRVRMILD